jgi:peptidoglycan/LPS O-acetylase OafA/YrhL
MGESSLHITFQSKLARSHKYRPDIDGLRALAVLPVLFFHARVPGFSGGFVGVDIFYVISGYLITSLILKDIVGGRFSFVTFYERRMRRIFPALFGVLFFCIVAGAVLYAPRDFMAFGKSMMAMTFFASNVFFKRQGGMEGYFGGAAELQALLHTWSLSVEEQFYLFFPAALLLLIRWAKGRAAQSLLVVAIVSFLICLWATLHRPLAAFYILIPRAWELLIGTLLAMKAVPPLNRRGSREIAGLVGLGLIVCAVVFLTKDSTFPGLNALFPCLGAWLIVYAGENGPSCLKTILSFQPLVFIGVISYSLYLWHWPVLVFSRYFSAGDLDAVETAIALMFSLVMAFVSFEFIEGPFRGGDSQFTRRQIFSLGLAVSLLSVALASAIYYFHGFPGRYPGMTRQLVLSNSDRKDDYQEVCGNWKNEVLSLSDITFCTIGSNPTRKIMFWGDSHVQQLYPLIKKLHDSGELQDHGVLLAIANGCPPTEHMNTMDKGYHCDSFAKFAMMRAEEKDVDTVFMGFNTWWSVHEDICPSVDGRCVEAISMEETRHRFIQELSAHIQQFEMRGKRVIVSLPFPIYDKSIPDLEIRNAIFGRFGLTGVATDITLPGLRDQVASAAISAGADIFDPRASLCPNDNCITQSNGVSIYKDSNHIAASQVGILEDNLKQVLQYSFFADPHPPYISSIAGR